MTRTQLYLPEDHYEELKQLAFSRKITFASLVRSYIEEKLAQEKLKKQKARKANPLQILKKSLAVIDSLKEKAVVRDGSIHHDRYLY